MIWILFFCILFCFYLWTRARKTSRLQPDFTTKAQGSGMGLFLVDRIIKDHGGRLVIKSKAGKGTCISFTLPGIDRALQKQID